MSWNYLQYQGMAQKTLNGCEPFDIYGIGASRDLKGPLEIEIP